MLENLCQDLWLAGRGLRHAKAFTTAAILTLALGIAGTTVMFALIQGVLLQPLSVRVQEELLVAWKELRSSGYAHFPFGDTEIEEVARASQLLESVAGVTSNGVTRWVIVEDGVSSYVTGAWVTGSFFDVLGVNALLGRTLTRADEVDGAEQVLVISHGLWQRRYGSSRDVIGRSIRVDDRRFTIVGVVPTDLGYPRGVEMWRTTRSASSRESIGGGARREVDLIARLRPGVTIQQAASELTALTQRLEVDAPRNVPPGLTPVVRSFEDVVVGDVRTAMLVLFSAVGFVLLIASANVANLLLMRGEARREELAVRAALGADRSRLVRQVLAESLVLSIAAGFLGLAVAWRSLQALMTLIPDGLPRVESVRVDATVLAFTVGVVFVTALVSGLAPALSAARLDLVSHLRSGGRGVTGPTARRGRLALVVAQVALAVTVVTAAGLLTRSLLHLQSVDMGIAVDRLVFVELSLPQAKYADRTRHAQFLDAVVAQLEAAPAIDAATPVNVPPFSGTGGWKVPRFAAEGQTAERAATNPSLNLESVHQNYFATFGITVVRGRSFTIEDRAGAINVAIVSEDVAARTWPGKEPIGKRLKMGGADSRSDWLTVVGVAASTRYKDLVEPHATLYLPAAQFLDVARMLVLRTGAPLDLLTSIARERVRTVDPDVLVMRVAPFTNMLDAPLARPRFNAFLIGIFGTVALLLAAIGLYAVMAAYVRQREREIGIRVALGATGSHVRRLVLGEGLWLAGLGAAIGLVGAAAAARLVRGLLFDVHLLDASTLLGVALLLVAAAAFASYLPMRRATRIDAVVMLRSD